MNARGAERYARGDRAGGIAGCRFDFNRDLAGLVVDVSLMGFGIEIRNITGSILEEIQTAGTCMITVEFGSETVMAAVKNVWNMVSFEEGVMVFKGGFAIDVISPGDRLILGKIIETMRSGR